MHDYCRPLEEFYGPQRIKDSGFDFWTDIARHYLMGSCLAVSDAARLLWAWGVPRVLEDDMRLCYLQENLGGGGEVVMGARQCRCGRGAAVRDGVKLFLWICEEPAPPGPKKSD